MRHRTTLIQRLSRIMRPDPTFILYQRFDFDYMGAAEFEFGTIPNTIRELHRRGTVLRTFTIDSFECTYAGPDDPDILADAADVFIDQVTDTRKRRFKGFTAIRQSYVPEDRREGRVGWLSVDEDHPFALFKDLDDAKFWAEALPVVIAHYDALRVARARKDSR